MPVLMAADGPKALQVAGRVADGVVVGVGMSLEVVDAKIAAFGPRLRQRAAIRTPC